MEVNDQIHAPAALLTEKTNTHWIGGWVGPRAGLDAVANRKFLSPVGNRTPITSPCTIIPTELSPVHRFEVRKLINSIRNKEELLQQWEESIIVPICKMGCEIYCSNDRGIHCYQLQVHMESYILVSNSIRK
jgi:hypothetical protein